MSAAAMTFCCTSGIFNAFAEDAPAAEVKIVFDIGGARGLTDFAPDEDTDIAYFDDISTDGKSILIPDGSFELEGYTFSGWSADGIYGYLGGDRFYIPEGSDEVVLHGMWTKNDDDLLAISYDLIYKGEQLEKPFAFKDKYARPGSVYTPYDAKIEVEHAFSKGYTCDDLVEGETVRIEAGSRLIMPEHEITLVPIFLEIVTFTYYAGDVDRLNGNDTYAFPRNEGSSTELADPDRFSRSGFDLTGWHSSYDDKIYAPTETIIVPPEDVTYTAVWTPKNYVVVFITGNGGSNFKVPGVTDTTIVCPEPDVTVAGKKFAGWKDSTGKLHAPGSEYLILGAMPGLGISLKGEWVDDTKEPEIISGDANCDGQVTIADAAAILQYLGNNDKYPLSDIGKLNADCYETGDGITAKDSLMVQMMVTDPGSEE